MRATIDPDWSKGHPSSLNNGRASAAVVHFFASANSSFRLSCNRHIAASPFDERPWRYIGASLSRQSLLVRRQIRWLVINAAKVSAAGGTSACNPPVDRASKRRPPKTFVIVTGMTAVEPEASFYLKSLILLLNLIPSCCFYIRT